MTLNESIGKAISSICHYYPFLSGCGTIANTFLKPFTPNDPLLLCRLAGHVRIFVNPSDYVGRSIYFFGDLDPKVSTICQKILNKGDVFVDIGANYGLLSLLAANSVGEEGRVYAIEPQPELASLIQRSAKENGYNNIQVFPIGLSNTNASMPLFIPSHNLGAASLTPVQECASKQVDVILKNASDFFDELALKKIKLIKIDVEGHEDALMEGCKEYFIKNPPEAIIIEVHASDKHWKENRSLNILDSLGYKIYALPKTLIQLRLTPLSNNESLKTVSNDYVAIHRSSEISLF